MHPEIWIARCAARLHALVHDEHVTDEHLHDLATAMCEERAYRDMAPELAAEKQHRDEA